MDGEKNQGTEYGAGNSSKRSYKTVRFNGRWFDMYLQAHFSDVPFQGKSIAQYGCSAVAFATVMSGFDDSITVEDAATMVTERSFTGIKRALDSCGMDYTREYRFNSCDSYRKDLLQPHIDRIKDDFLGNGWPVIMLINGDTAGEHKYAGSRHFITLLGFDDDDNVIISNCRTDVGDLNEILTKYCVSGGFYIAIKGKK